MIDSKHSIWRNYHDSLDILEHPNKKKYSNQLLLLVEIDRYVVVSCILENDVCFLKLFFRVENIQQDILI